MDKKIKIRNYKPGDREACRSLWAEMVEQHRKIYDDPTIGGENPGLEFDCHLRKVGADMMWIAEYNGTIAGLSSLIIKEHEAELEPLVIGEKFRGKGIGKILVNHLIKEAKKQGAALIFTKPVARNKEAVSFFYNAGFKTLGHLQMFIWLADEVPCSWKKGPEIFDLPFDY